MERHRLLAGLRQEPLLGSLRPPPMEIRTATPGDAPLKGKWWEIFGDPKLNELEETLG